MKQSSYIVHCKKCKYSMKGVTMRSEPLKAMAKRLAKSGLGKQVSVKELKKVIGTRRPQGIAWELRQWGAVVEPVKEGRRAVAYVMKKKPNLERRVG
jgi:hypothetical protein